MPDSIAPPGGGESGMTSMSGMTSIAPPPTLALAPPDVRRGGRGD